MSSYWCRADPISSVTGVLVERGNLDRGREGGQRGRAREETQGEARHVQAKRGLGLVFTHSLRRNWPSPHLDVQLPELGEKKSLNSFLCIRPRNFWHLKPVLTLAPESSFQAVAVHARPADPDRRAPWGAGPLSPNSSPTCSADFCRHKPTSCGSLFSWWLSLPRWSVALCWEPDSPRSGVGGQGTLRKQTFLLQSNSFEGRHYSIFKGRDNFIQWGKRGCGGWPAALCQRGAEAPSLCHLLWSGPWTLQVPQQPSCSPTDLERLEIQLLWLLCNKPIQRAGFEFSLTAVRSRLPRLGSFLPPQEEWSGV